MIMEPEIKLRLKDSVAHFRLSSVLSPYLVQTHQQHNYFIRNRVWNDAYLLVRFYGEDPSSAYQCVLCFKSKTTVVDGVSRVHGYSEQIDLSLGLAIRANPSIIESIEESEVINWMQKEFPEQQNEYMCLGGFISVRRVYKWERLKLEVDETFYEFGTLYELECESSDPEEAKELIEGYLMENGISYSYSKMSKFEIYQAGELSSF